MSGKDGSHHTSTDTSGSEFGSDNGRHRIVAADSNTHKETPPDNHTVDRDTETLTSEGCAEGTDNDDDLRSALPLPTDYFAVAMTYQFDTIHSLAPHYIAKPAKQQLTTKGTDRVGDFDTEVLVCGVAPALVVDVSNHRGGDTDAENVVRICKEPHACYEAGLDVEPLLISSQRRLRTAKGLTENLASSSSCRAARRLWLAVKP